MINKKGKATRLEAINSYRGNSCIAPLILNFGTRWMSLVNIMPGPLYDRKVPRYQLHRKTEGPQIFRDIFEKRKISHPYRDSKPRNVHPVAWPLGYPLRCILK
jgi:hypothetical protein